MFYVNFELNIGLPKNHGNLGGREGLLPRKSGQEGEFSDSGNPGRRGGGYKMTPSVGVCGFFLE